MVLGWDYILAFQMWLPWHRTDACLFDSGSLDTASVHVWPLNPHAELSCWSKPRRISSICRLRSCCRLVIYKAYAKNASQVIVYTPNKYGKGDSSNNLSFGANWVPANATVETNDHSVKTTKPVRSLALVRNSWNHISRNPFKVANILDQIFVVAQRVTFAQQVD